MSCDYGVWFPHRKLSDDEAGELYVRLCEGDVAGVVPHPAVGAFYDELTATHPEIDTVTDEQLDDKDLCPWSCALDRSDGHVIMSCVWSKADDVGQLVASLADRHGLVFYDPQSERVRFPGEARAKKPWWKPW